MSDNKPVEALVSEILKNVRERGDAAVREYSEKFDKSSLDVFEVTEAEREAALRELAPQTRQDTEFAIANVRKFAEAQLGTILPLEIETLPGVHLGHRVIPIERVGCYVPGGRYPLLSAPIMRLTTFGGASSVGATISSPAIFMTVREGAAAPAHDAACGSSSAGDQIFH